MVVNASRRLGALVMVLVLVGLACSPPTSLPSSSAGTPAAPSAGGSGAVPSAGASGGPAISDKLSAVYAAVEGLTGDARRTKLIELAKAEGGEVNVYTSTALEESQPLTDAFTKATDIDVNLYRASAGTVLQRVTQEAQASFQGGADAIAINGPEMTILDSQKLLAPLKTPATASILKEGVFDNWSAMYLNVFVAAWNKDKVSPDQAPKSYEDLFTKFKGRLGMELGDWDWFSTLVKYFVAKKGMTEEQAVDMFKNAAKGARVVDGHSLMTELLASGEFDVTASNYQHRVLQLLKDKAPIAWEPPIQPVVVRPNGIGISATAARPASALLYLEYVLEEGQDLFLDLSRTPASTEALGGLNASYEVLFTDVQALLNERDKWEGLYEEVVKESGKVIEQ
jgi:iron(III) transport system substrate-binding protein